MGADPSVAESLGLEPVDLGANPGSASFSLNDLGR